MNVEEWKSQIKRGTLEYCVLLLISHKDCYGYEIMSELSKFPIVATKESTTYPLLRRLEKDEYLYSYWQETNEGVPPRKYYRITEKGISYKDALTKEWDDLFESIQVLRMGGVTNG